MREILFAIISVIGGPYSFLLSRPFAYFAGNLLLPRWEISPVYVAIEYTINGTVIAIHAFAGGHCNHAKTEF